MSENSGTIRITRATRVEAPPQPVAMSRKSADLALTQSSAGAKPSTRGPHTQLFQGGLPAKKSAPEPELTIAQRLAAFAKARKLTRPQAAILGVVAAHVLTYGVPLANDRFVVAKTAAVDYETEFKSARDKLLNAGILRMRSAGAIGVDGFDLGAGVNL